MPKDSKNGFYRQEQNIGRLISPLLRGRLRRTQSAAPRGAVHRAPVAVRHCGAWLGIPPHCRALSP